MIPFSPSRITFGKAYTDTAAANDKHGKTFNFKICFQVSCDYLKNFQVEKMNELALPPEVFSTEVPILY
jgi:hypothetical protein